MKRAHLWLAALAALLASPFPAAAQGADGLRIGLRVGAYFPSDADVREAFGEVLPIVGLARSMPPRPGSFFLFPNLELSGGSTAGNRFLLLPLTLMAEYQLPVGTTAAVPFVRAEGGVAYYDYRVRLDTATVVRARRGGPAAAAEAGVLLTRYLRASARYRWFQEYDELDFSGVELNFVVGALRLF